MIQDHIRYAARVLLKTPLHTITSILTLAIGLGGAAAVFGVIASLLLRPLPFPNPNQLVSVNQTNTTTGRTSTFSFPDTDDVKESIGTFSDLAGYQSASFSLSIGAQTEQVAGALATQGFFSTMGVQPELGRSFSETDPDGAIVISYSLWKSRFNSQRSVLGIPIKLDGRTSTIIGVMPPQFWFPKSECQLWRLVTWDYPLLKLSGDYHFLRMVGRMKPDSSLAQTKSALKHFTSIRSRQHPDIDPHLQFDATSLDNTLLGDTKPILLVFLIAVIGVLIIACVNVASLQLTRFVPRRNELAIRMALGSGWLRLAQLLAIETILLTLSASILGLLIAYLILRLTQSVVLLPVPISASIVIAPTNLLLILGTSLSIGIGLGTLGVISAAHRGILRGVNEGGRGASMGRASSNAQRAFSLIQIALTYPLLILVALMWQNFRKLSTVNVGFNSESLSTATIRLSPQAYASSSSLTAYRTTIADQLSKLPGVEGVATSSDIPLVSGFQNSFAIKGKPMPSPSEREFVLQASTGPGFFHVMRIPILRGREFSELDRVTTARVAIINETMARKFWGTTSPIGWQLRHGQPDEPTQWYSIVGVVGDTRLIMSRPPEPKIYTPFTQIPQDYDELLARPVTFIIRSSNVYNANLLSEIRKSILAVDPTVGYDVHSIDDVIAESLLHPKLQAVGVASLGGVAFWLSIIGLYGAISASILSQARAIAIYLAFGAPPSFILWFVFRRGMIVVTGGLGLGIVIAFILQRFVQLMLVGIHSLDVSIVLWIGCLLLLTSLPAIYLPARSAAAIDPKMVLKNG